MCTSPRTRAQAHSNPCSTSSCLRAHQRGLTETPFWAVRASRAVRRRRRRRSRPTSSDHSGHSASSAGFRTAVFRPLRTFGLVARLPDRRFQTTADIRPRRPASGPPSSDHRGHPVSSPGFGAAVFRPPRTSGLVAPLPDQRLQTRAELRPCLTGIRTSVFRPRPTYAPAHPGSGTPVFRPRPAGAEADALGPRRPSREPDTARRHARTGV